MEGEEEVVACIKIQISGEYDALNTTNNEAEIILLAIIRNLQNKAR
jgi:hypothetical protein